MHSGYVPPREGGAGGVAWEVLLPRLVLDLLSADRRKPCAQRAFEQRIDRSLAGGATQALEFLGIPMISKDFLDLFEAFYEDFTKKLWS